MATHGYGGITTDALTSAPEDITGLSNHVPQYEPSHVGDPKHDHSNALQSVHEYDGFGRPTEEERLTLRRVSGSIPKIAYILCIVEFAERASYYGCSGVFSNFVEFPLPAGGNGAGATPKGSQETPGALNKGLSTSSALTLLFTFMAYCTPILGGWLADVKLGRYKVICLGVLICGIGHIVLVVGAIPKILQAGNGMAPFVIGLLTLAFGAGLFKPNLFPVILDQDTQHGLIVKTLKSGERVIQDPEISAQQLALAYYGLVNVGAFFQVATTYSEKYVGYWLAYLLPGIIYFLLPILLFVVYKRTIKKPPGGSDLGKFLRVIGTCFKRNGLKNFGQAKFLDAAKPSVLASQGITTLSGKSISWNDGFVEDVRRTLEACQIFLFFPVYNMNDGGIGNIQTSQGGSMTTNGAPNDLLGNFNPLTIIVAIPIMSYGMYPLLRKYKIKFGPIARITVGFILGALSTTAGAVTQYYVYQTSPCGYYATDCQIGTGVSPISIWVQTPQYVLSALSECFANVTALEIAYARSPKNMKGLVMSMYLFSTAISSAIQEACTASLIDPYLIWPFAATAIAGVVLAAWFYWLYRHLDDDEFLAEGVAEEDQGLVRDESGSGSAGNADEKVSEKV
ncbi:related to peptide transport protein [Phialocephala subalpina]|uniref:Related to peptide transport protein n=1 Tax=Phialocephala subalpina TaxID=576137 RepID=A0A1L7XI60_9HELO|nr:related to peptide transport protein [Phialocephala subalpina]